MSNFQIFKKINSLFLGASFALMLVGVGHFLHFSSSAYLFSFLVFYFFIFSEEFSKFHANKLTLTLTLKQNEIKNLILACIGFFLVEQTFQFFTNTELYLQNPMIIGIKSFLVLNTHICASLVGLFSFRYFASNFSRFPAEVLGLLSASTLHFFINLSFSEGYIYLGAIVLAFTGYRLFENIFTLNFKLGR